MRKTSIFPKIIYFLFTFLIGLLLAFILPYYFMFFEIPLDDIENYLNSGEYSKAMELVGGYYNQQYVYQQSFDDGGGIVLFEATTLVYNSGEEEDKTQDESKLHKSYAGFIYGIGQTYVTGGENDNRTKLLVSDADKNVKTWELLDYDTNGNGVKDDIASLVSNGFIYLDLDYDTFHSVEKLEFIDANGEVFCSVEVGSEDKKLDYSSAFFVDVNEFVEEYNKDFKSDKLPGLYEEFIAKNDNYKRSSYGDTKKKAENKATVVVVVYFVVIYIVADFLVGGRYIIRFFKWVFGKLRKHKPKEGKNQQDTFGNDYFSQVTMSLDTSEVEEFSESVQVGYSKADQDVCFILMKENGYTDTKRVQVGYYLNARMDINGNYAPVDMPEQLVVKGYKMSVKIKITKR